VKSCSIIPVAFLVSVVVVVTRAVSSGGGPKEVEEQSSVVEGVDGKEEATEVESIGEGFEKETAEGLLDPAVLDPFGMDGEEAGEVKKKTGGLLDSAVLDPFRMKLDVEGTGCGVELFVNPCFISRLTAKHISSRYILKLTLKGLTISISMWHMGLKRGINCQNKYHE
jgi:hypothetical protein